jgi:predicted acyl esterase
VSLAQLEATTDSESRTDQRMLHASIGKRLVYHSAPFEQDVEISGFFRFSAWLAIDRPDTDFRAAVYEVALDGSALQLAVDSLRARYRTGAREPALIETEEPLHYSFESFTFVARRLAKGSRLRLVFGPIDSIYSERNYNSGGVVAEESIKDARPVTVRLFHDEQRPSILHVPFGQAEET